MLQVWSRARQVHWPAVLTLYTVKTSISQALAVWWIGLSQHKWICVCPNHSSCIRWQTKLSWAIWPCSALRSHSVVSCLVSWASLNVCILTTTGLIQTESESPPLLEQFPGNTMLLKAPSNIIETWSKLETTRTTILLTSWSDRQVMPLVTAAWCGAAFLQKLSTFQLFDVAFLFFRNPVAHSSAAYGATTLKMN